MKMRKVQDNNMPTTTTENYDQNMLTKLRAAMVNKKSSIFMRLRPNYVSTPAQPNRLHTTKDKVYILSKIWDSLSPGRKLLDLPFYLKHLIHFRIDIYFIR